jgi:uncharacterized repeat protein (TIGR01451 family)
MFISRRFPFLGFFFIVALVMSAGWAGSFSPTAQAQTKPRVVYVYQDDTASAASFKTLLELRGYEVLVVKPEDITNSKVDWKGVQALIVGHDTDDHANPGNWAGRTSAVPESMYVIGIGVGGTAYFESATDSVAMIDYWSTVAGNGNVALASNPGAAYWLTPSPIALAADTSVKLYNQSTPWRAADNAIPLKIAQDNALIKPVPIAAEEFGQGTWCGVLWGYSGSPSHMTNAGRDLFVNIVKQNACKAPLGSSVDLSITKSAPQSGTVGQPLTYTITVNNPSRVAAPGVKVVDTLPADVVFVSASSTQGSCSYGGGIVTCAIGTMASGATVTITIVVKPSEAGTLVNTATVSATAHDSNLSNNTSSAHTSVAYPVNFNALRAFPYKPVLNITDLIPNKDLSIFGIEVTQGIQCFDTSKGLTTCANNSLSLVSRKSTVARIYLKYTGPGTGMNNVPVRLHIIDAEGDEVVVNTVGKALPAIDQSSAANSANVYFYVDYNSSPSIKFWAEVDPNKTIAEINESNNRFPATGMMTIKFNKRSTMKIVGDRLRYHPSGYSGTQYAGGWAVNGGAADWLEQVLPIRNNGINYQVKSGYRNWTTTLNTDGQHSLIRTLNGEWIIHNIFPWLFGTNAFTGARHVYGWAPNAGYSGGHADMPIYPHAGGLGVVGIGTDRVGSSPSTDNPGGGALIFGHELVHDYNIMHTNTSDSCGSSDSNSNFPYSSSSIQEFGFNPVTGKVYNPSNTHDLMSYCPAAGSREGWISPYTWQQMFNKLSTSSTQAAVAPSADGSTLIVDVTVSNPSMGPETGTFNNLMKVDVAVPSVTPAPGDYAIDLLNASNTILSTTTFSVTFKSEYTEGGEGRPGDPSIRPYASASMNIPWVDGTTQIRLRRGATQLKVQTVSANPPQVQFTSPAAAATWPAGTVQTLTWQGIDPDTGNGNGLTYSLFYSHNGVDWALLESGITDTSYQVAVDSLAGGTAARFRIVASDGVLIGDDETDFPINVPDKAPTAYILNPTTGSTALPGDLVVLSGFGNDFEDGTLPELSLSWKSDRQGDLGTGEQIATTSLDAGLHKITLTVTDSKGQTSTATAEIFIGTRLLLPVTIR